MVHRERDGVTVFSLGEAKNQAETLQLLEQVSKNLHRNNPYNAVVGFYAVPVGAVAVSVAKQLGLPSLICLRGNDVDRAFYQSGRSGLLQWTLAKATKVVAVSKELQTKANIIGSREDVQFLPNSVDAQVFAPQELEPAEAPRILFSGEMRFKKGLDVLLDSLFELEGDWTLQLAGGIRAESLEHYKKWCALHPRLASRIQLRKYRRDPAHLRELYNQATVVVNPALWEGMPNSVLEALACARPVLATAVGGVPDLIEDGKTGWLVEPHRLDGFGERLKELLKDPQREALGLAGREHVLRHHTPSAERDGYLKLLSELCQ